MKHEPPPEPEAALETRLAHVVVVGNEKGGAGKSTIAMHLTVALLRMGKRVGVIDLDIRQRSLTRYVENRRAWVRARGAGLPMPQIAEVRASLSAHKPSAETEETCLFNDAMLILSERCEHIVIDSPGGDTHYARLVHACADTLITPMNDSFVDFDLLGDVDPLTFEVVRPSFYAEMVWESRKQKAQAARRPIDWVLLRNRLSASKIEAKNKQKVGEALVALSTRIGFRIAPGFSERVVFREMFPQGLTLLDVTEEGAEAGLRMGHVAARQEVRDFLIALKLPGLEGERLRF